MLSKTFCQSSFELSPRKTFAARVTLKGHDIWSDPGSLCLGGQAFGFGVPASQTIASFIKVVDNVP
jgi:hypothetical protein